MHCTFCWLGHSELALSATKCMCLAWHTSGLYGVWAHVLHTYKYTESVHTYVLGWSSVIHSYRPSLALVTHILCL